MTQLRKMMLEEVQARKITALVLGWVEDWMVRSASRGFGVAEASSKFLSCFDRLVTARARVLRNHGRPCPNGLTDAPRLRSLLTENAHPVKR